MTRLSMSHFVMIGLILWGIPAAFVAGPSAILYTIVATLIVWVINLGHTSQMPRPDQSTRLGPTSCVILVLFALCYLLLDATVGQRLLSVNLFLHGTKSTEVAVEQAQASISEGRGVFGLVGTILGLTPFCFIDVAPRAERLGKAALWTAAILYIFYGLGSSRGAVIIALLTIFMGRNTNWRRLLVAGAITFPFFALASVLRGDYSGGQSPLRDAIAFPHINLLLMLSSHCGSASWTDFVAEFLKKFVPAFVFPKHIYSFNLETSLCIYPSLDNTVSAVSIFTWLGEIYYYQPSILTAISAGVLLGVMARIANYLLVKNGMPTARIAAGFACVILLRSRSQDVLSYLIAQVIFLSFWPHLCRLPVYLRYCVRPVRSSVYSPEVSEDLS
jgi:hypothetical protein